MYVYIGLLSKCLFRPNKIHKLSVDKCLWAWLHHLLACSLTRVPSGNLLSISSMAPDHALRREALLDDAVLIGTGLWRPFSTLTTPVQLFLAEHVSARILELRDG